MLMTADGGGVPARSSARFVTKYPFSRSTLILGIVGAIAAVWAVVLLWPGRAPLWLLVVLVVVTAVGGPGSMVGFDLARTFNPPTRIGSATGIVNVGRLPRLAVDRHADRDHPRPRGARRAQHLHRRLLPGRDVGAVPRLGDRRGPDRALPPARAARPRENNPEAYAALRAGEAQLPT